MGWNNQWKDKEHGGKIVNNEIAILERVVDERGNGTWEWTETANYHEIIYLGSTKKIISIEITDGKITGFKVNFDQRGVIEIAIFKKSCYKVAGIKRPNNEGTITEIRSLKRKQWKID